jgi:TatD DNase family protein
MIERAIAANITQMMNPGVDLETSRNAVAVANQYPQVFAAVGFHPHEAAGMGEAEFRVIRELAAESKVKAIGEIGLDYYRNLSPHDMQARAFRQQLELATELDLPVIIHCRDAFDDVLSILREWHSSNDRARGVMHSFSGDRKQAEAVFKIGFWIGITGPITFPKSDEMRAVAQTAPLEHIVIETDAPYLTPIPYRGKRNEPAYVRHVAEKIAEVRGLTIETVAAQTTANADLLFDWSKDS